MSDASTPYAVAFLNSCLAELVRVHRDQQARLLAEGKDPADALRAGRSLALRIRGLQEQLDALTA